ncbi:MAG: hypothetical protein AAB903_03460 [Patescibacteria group bacterium]
MMPHYSKRKVILASIFAIGLLVGLGFLIYTAPQETDTPNPNPISITPQNGPVTIRGMIVCLPHLNTEGPQTLECAYGLQDEKGIYYTLNDVDPGYKNISAAPMDVLVEVEGIFIQKTSLMYQSIGIISVTSIHIADTPKRISLSGEYLCLPHKDTTGPQTDECASGLKTNDGYYYALDFSPMSQMVPDLKSGDGISANGIFVAVEQLSSDHWQNYPIKGTFSVTDSLKKSAANLP